MKTKYLYIPLLVAISLLCVVSCGSGETSEIPPPSNYYDLNDSLYEDVVDNRDYSGGYSFIAVADMRQYGGVDYQTSEYFLGAVQAIDRIGKGSFMISPGDIDPPDEVYETIASVLGYDYQWYPVVGNHESETPYDMDWLRQWGQDNVIGVLNEGPVNSEETSYSFDFDQTHFIVINEYYDGNSDIATNGNISPALYSWIENDLKNTDKPLIFVFGHEPIVSIPDDANGRLRHVGDSLDAYPETTERFKQLLLKYNVAAYVQGHTHNFSYANLDGLWQIDAGHARGKGDTGAKSTFLKFIVKDDFYKIEVYRDDSNGGEYILEKTLTLN